MGPGLDSKHIQVEAIYNLWEFPDGDVLIRRMIRDLMFMCPLRALATAWHQNQLNSYVYVFDFSALVLFQRSEEFLFRIRPVRWRR